MFYKKRIDRFSGLCTLAAVASLTGCSAGDDGPAASSRDEQESLSLVSATAQLKAAHPRAKVHVHGNRIRRVYGVVTTGKTPASAAESFRQQSATALGVAPDDLVSTRPNRAASRDTDGVGLMYNPATGKYKFRLYSYQQQRDGVPVFRGDMRTLVREEGNNPVVWANADLRPMGNFRAEVGVQARSVDVEKSLQALQASAGLSVQSLPAPTALTQVSAPTRTIFAGIGTQSAAPRNAITYTAQDANGAGKWTFVADAATGDILHVESNIHFNVNGTVKGKVITGPESIECGTLGIAPLPHAKVTSTTGSAFADATGAFTLPYSGNATVTVSSDVTGKYFNVVDAGSSDSIALVVTPPGPANFLHQDTVAPPERVLAQLNAYKSANEIHDMLLTYVPEYPVIFEQTNFTINVNRTDVMCDEERGLGGAWYDDDVLPRTINFCQRTRTHANTAFGSIVYHEYGHHIIDSAGSGQAEYGEGMADTIAMLFTKNPELGLGYELNCHEPIRNAATNCQYSATDCSSCGPGIYECGGLLSGIIWDIWQKLDVTEPSKSNDIIRSLVLNSVPLHTGTSINESLAIDLLTLDDDDGLLENGTPHYAEICTGFALHGMNCPPIVDGLVVKVNGAELDAEGPSDGPFLPGSTSYTLHNLGPQENLTYSVKVPADAQWLSVDNTGGTIALGQHTAINVSIVQAQAALLPDGNYSAILEFVNESSGAGTVSRTVKLQIGAPVPIYTATFNDGLEGFTVDTEFDNLWHQSTACADGLPGHTSPGSLYYGKDNGCNYNVGTPYLHTITSPVIKVPNSEMAELGFKYYLKTLNSSEYDKADVRMSVDGGPFQIVASNNNGGNKLNETSAWEELRFDISERLPATGPTSIQLQVGFNGVSLYGKTKTGFVIDDITVYAKPADASQGPCAAYCANPVTFSANGYHSGNLSTGASCHETTGPLSGGVCGNFVSSRQLFVNGVQMKCNWAPWSSLPPAKNGGYCVYTTSGDYPWAAFTTW